MIPAASLSRIQKLPGVRALGVLNGEGQILFQDQALPEKDLLTLSSLLVGLIQVSKEVDRHVRPALSSGSYHSKSDTSDFKLTSSLGGSDLLITEFLPRFFLFLIHDGSTFSGKLHFELQQVACEIRENYSNQGNLDPASGGKSAHGVSTAHPLFEDITDHEIDLIFNSSTSN